jgi:hypothetical protein
MSIEKDPYDPLDFHVPSSDPGSETSQSYDPIDPPEPAGSGKIVQSSLYHGIPSTQGMSEGFQRHAGITDVLAVIVAQQCQSTSANRLDRFLCHPEFSQRPGGWFGPRHLSRGGMGEAQQKRKRVGWNPLRPASECRTEARSRIPGSKAVGPQAAPPGRKRIEYPAPADGGDRAKASEHESVLCPCHQGLF